MMTVMIPQKLRESLQDWVETRSIMGNIVDSAIVNWIEREHLVDITGERLTSIVHMGETIKVMTSNLLGNPAFIAPVVRFVKGDTQRALDELKTVTKLSEFIETGIGNKRIRFVAVSLEMGRRL